MEVDFFDKAVIGILTIDDFDKICSETFIGNTVVQYYTEKQDETYNTIALARYKKATYRIQCVSAEEDVSGVFTDLFGEVSRGR